VFRGDVIVMGTDGLLDNVSELEILDLVRIRAWIWRLMVSCALLVMCRYLLVQPCCICLTSAAVTTPGINLRARVPLAACNP
jgi:hypothetical protein